MKRKHVTALLIGSVLPPLYACDDSTGSGPATLRVIAYASVRPTDPDDADIFAMRADATDETRLTTTGVGHPDWSPDGAQILFASNREGGEQLFVMDADGSNVRNLTPGPGSYASAAWKP
jgi:Tol biopolymer transport system component